MHKEMLTFVECKQALFNQRLFTHVNYTCKLLICAFLSVHDIKLLLTSISDFSEQKMYSSFDSISRKSHIKAVLLRPYLNLVAHGRARCKYSNCAGSKIQ